MCLLRRRKKQRETARSYWTAPGLFYSVHLPMVTLPPATLTASRANSTSATCSTVGFLSGFM
jgi:hypothetical protein